MFNTVITLGTMDMNSMFKMMELSIGGSKGPYFLFWHTHFPTWYLLTVTFCHMLLISGTKTLGWLSWLRMFNVLDLLAHNNISCLRAVPIMYWSFEFFKRGTPSKFALSTGCLYSNKYGRRHTLRLIDRVSYMGCRSGSNWYTRHWTVKRK